jgi:DNA excision repair protein ERCC-2
MGETKDNNVSLFPYDNIRPVQDSFMKDVSAALLKKTDLIVHAPTGLGKTIGVLSPALMFALENKKKILFLTSRQTQHMLAVETLKDIKEKCHAEISVADIIGKKWMCPQEGTDGLYSGEFAEYCRTMKEGGKCEFYNKTKKTGKLTVEGKKAFEDCSKMIHHSERLMELCSKDGLCSYEIALEVASKADVIIADFYYAFNPTIAKNFLSKTQIDLKECIIIIDEAHNLPARIMELATSRLSNVILGRAVKEAKKYGYSETGEHIKNIEKALVHLASGLNNKEEKIVKRSEFIKLIDAKIEFDQLQADLEFAADAVRESQRQSYLGSVAQFMQSWLGAEEGFARIISMQKDKGQDTITLFNHCLDPSMISKTIINDAYTTIMMSGTLTPTEMYNDVLGFSSAAQKIYKSPFPEENRLNLIIPKTTTKFTKRDEAQFKAIAEVCAEITDNVPGNSILFFPSYFIRDMVNLFFSAISKKTVFQEAQDQNKAEKEDLLERFKKYKKAGAVMLGVASGSFAEGINLPGDFLKCVVVVGLPLQQPDLRTKELIQYYDNKFKKGWDYGYLFPAFNKALQSAGRCIRSETDRGVVIFLDERYAWQNYYRCFPPDWDMRISKDYARRIKEFFENKKTG